MYPVTILTIYSLTTNPYPRSSTKTPPVLQRLVMDIRPRIPEKTGKNDGKKTEKIVDAKQIIRQFSSLLLGCIISVEDIYTTTVSSNSSSGEG